MPLDSASSPTLIKNGSILEDGDDWIVLAKDTGVIPKEGQVLVPVELWNEHSSELTDTAENSLSIGVWLDSNESPELVARDVERFDLIAINFPLFSDGRGYSYARTLREEYGYTGDIRAIGDVLPDQLSYMKRCGFTSFELRGDRDPQDALARFDDFSDAYQAGQDEPKPLFARR